jgi:DNA-binding NarL/FixJ family response regulator
MMNGVYDIVSGKTFFPKNDGDAFSYMPAYFEEKRAKKRQDNGAFQLTPREEDVLDVLLTGATNSEIADRLELKLVTVKLHVRGICRKMQAGNRTQAVVIAKEHGY